eukprot:3739831-Prymnesium_polylepis.1
MGLRHRNPDGAPSDSPAQDGSRKYRFGVAARANLTEFLPVTKTYRRLHSHYVVIIPNSQLGIQKLRLFRPSNAVRRPPGRPPNVLQSCMPTKRMGCIAAPPPPRLVKGEKRARVWKQTRRVHV